MITRWKNKIALHLDDEQKCRSRQQKDAKLIHVNNTKSWMTEKSADNIPHIG